MKSALNIKLFYGLSFAFLVASIVAIIFEFYAILALPAVVAVVWIYINKPINILYLVAFATPLSVHLIEERVSTINLSLPTEPLIVLLLLGVLLKLLKSNNLSLPELKTILSVLIIADFSWMLITTVTSSMPIISLKYIISKSWYIGVFYFLSSRLFQSNRVIKTVMWCLVASTVILCLYTLYNHSLGSFTRTYAYTAMRPFLPDHGMYAAAVALVTPLLFVFAVYGKKLQFNQMTRILSGGLFVFLCVAIALSFTRAAWVSIVAAFGIFAALQLKIKFRFLVVAGCILAGGVFANFDDLFTDLSRNKKESDDDIENHLQSVSNVTSDPSNLERLNRWSCAVKMVEDKPLLGFGPGTFTFQYGVYQLPHQMTIISTNAGALGGVHSEYLRPLAESGFLGAALFVSIVVCCFWLGFKQYYTLTGQERYLSLAAFLGLVTYFTHAVMNNYSEFDKIAVPLYAFMAVLTALEIKHKNGSKVSEE